MNLTTTKRSSSVPHNNLNHDNTKIIEESHNQSNILMKTTMNTFDNLKVVIRVRPPLQREMESDLPFRSIVKLKDN